MEASVRLGAMRRVRVASCAAGLWLAHVAFGCGQTVPVGVDEPRASAGAPALGGSGGSGGSAPAGAGMEAGTAGVTPGAGAPPCEPTLCRGKMYACGDCADNDEDGQVDALDAGCLGPCDDDDEAGLRTGLSSSGPACRQDCYFDGDAGPGNDKCSWSHQCDPLSVAPSYPPSGDARCAYEPSPSGLDCAQLSQEQPAGCEEACLPLVPNGCDCFGCCELPARSGEYRHVGAGRGSRSCSLDSLDDVEVCPPCTPVRGCFNDCQPCEACVGSGPDPSCGVGSSCEPGQDACGPGASCAFGFYCVTGCCARVPVR